MHTAKKLVTLVTTVLALSAVGAGSAFAATFTFSAAGEISGVAKATQVFTTNGGTVECTGASTTGTIVSWLGTEQHVTVKYSGCKAFGFVTVDISDATYNFTANGQVHIENTIKITVTGFLIHCTVTVGPQTVGTVDYATNGSNILVTPTVTGIKYTASGGVCGSSGENGTYTGANEVSRKGGGTLAFDP